MSHKPKELEVLTQDLATLAGLAFSATDAISKNKKSYLYLEFASVYGGYRLVMVRRENGAHYGAFGGTGIDARLPYKEMKQKLIGLIQGINFIKNENQ